jgi:RNA polymerase sigma factor (sigma-70 family)
MSPHTLLHASVVVMLLSLAPRQPTFHSLLLSAIASANESETVTARTQRLVIDLFRAEARSLVRLARLFVDDRDAAEDIVQEAFLRLARSATRIQDESKAPAYLRSIVLNLARDHNRRGLVSLRHHATAGREIDVVSPLEDELVRNQQHRTVLEAVRSLPTRQRDCVTLRYFEELGIDAIAAILKVSPNSVKTHLRRGMAALGQALEAEHEHA